MFRKLQRVAVRPAPLAALILPQKLRQLRHIGREPPRFVAGHVAATRAYYVTASIRRLTCIAVPRSITVLVAAAISILRTSTVGSPVVTSLCKLVLIPGRIAFGGSTGCSADEQQPGHEETG